MKGGDETDKGGCEETGKKGDVLGVELGMINCLTGTEGRGTLCDDDSVSAIGGAHPAIISQMAES